MKNKTYMKAIEYIAEAYFENEKLERKHEFLVSVHDLIKAEAVERAISSNISKMAGMKEMLSILSGKDFEDVYNDVFEAVH